MIPRGQQWFIKKRQQLGKNEKGQGYAGNIRGMCHGVSLEGVTAILAEEVPAFSARYQLLTDTPIDSLAGKVDKAKEQFIDWSHDAKKTLHSLETKWKETENLLRSEHKEPAELHQTLLQAKIVYKKAYTDAWRTEIEELEKKHFAGKAAEHERFKRFSELDAAAQTVEIHQLHHNSEYLLPASHLHVIDTLPTDFSSVSHDYFLIRSGNPASLKFYVIKKNKPLELKLQETTQLHDLIDKKIAGPNKTAVGTLHSLPTSDLWQEILAQSPEAKKIARERRDPVLATLKLMLPKKLEDSGGICQLLSLSGIYSDSELTNYFSSLQQSIDQAQPALVQPIAFHLGNTEHDITVGYHPGNKTWHFIDANQLHLSTEVIPNVDALVNHILSAFGSRKTIAMASRLFVAKAAQSDYTACMDRWKTNPAWQAMQEVTSVKALQKDDTGGSWLCIATGNNEADLAHDLLQHKADPHQARTSSGATPLYIAAQEGHRDIVHDLLQHKADPNQARTLDGVTPLFVAAQDGHRDIVNDLLQHKADPHQARAVDGVTPLLIAAQRGHRDIIHDLLQHNADPNQACTNGTTPLLIAAQQGHSEIVAMLIQHMKLAYPYDNVCKALHEALENKHLATVQVLLDTGVDIFRNVDGLSLLEHAKKTNHPDIIQLVTAHIEFSRIFKKRGHTSFAAKYQGDFKTLINQARHDFCAAKNENNKKEILAQFGKDLAAFDQDLKTDYKKKHPLLSRFGFYKAQPTHRKIERILHNRLSFGA